MSQYTQPKKITLKKPDGESFEFTVHPLHWKFMPELMKTTSSFASVGDIKDEALASKEFMKIMSDESIVTGIFTLVEETVKRYNPEWTSEEVSEFAGVYAFDLFPIISEVNMGQLGGRKPVQTGDRVAASQTK